MLGDYCGSPWFHPLGIVGQTSLNCFWTTTSLSQIVSHKSCILLSFWIPHQWVDYGGYLPTTTCCKCNLSLLSYYEQQRPHQWLGCPWSHSHLQELPGQQFLWPYISGVVANVIIGNDPLD